MVHSVYINAGFMITVFETCNLVRVTSNCNALLFEVTSPALCICRLKFLFQNITFIVLFVNLYLFYLDIYTNLKSHISLIFLIEFEYFDIL